MEKGAEPNSLEDPTFLLSLPVPGLRALLGRVCLESCSWQLLPSWILLVFSAWLFHVLDNVFIENCSSALLLAGTVPGTAALLGGDLESKQIFGVVPPWIHQTPQCQRSTAASKNHLTSKLGVAGTAGSVKSQERGPWDDLCSSTSWAVLLRVGAKTPLSMQAQSAPPEPGPAPQQPQSLGLSLSCCGLSSLLILPTRKKSYPFLFP